MVVYLSLTVVVVLLGLLVNNREYVQLYRQPWTREGSLSLARDYRGTMTRGRFLGLVLAVAIFVLLAAVSACRIAVGNDYWVYRFQFNLIMQDRHVSYEWGFNLVVWLIQSIFGYDNYLPVFGFFSIVTAFFFVKAIYDQAEWFGATVFLLMTGGYYFSSLNSVRYYLVLAMLMYATKYVMRKEYLKFILWILVAACFHKSVLVVIPFYILARWLAETKVPKWLYAIFGVLALSMVVFPDFYKKIIFIFYPFYEGSTFEQVDISYTNIAKVLATLVLALLFYRKALKENVINRFYFFLNLGGLVIYTCGSFIPEVSRIGYYFVVSQIFFIPSVLIRIEHKGWRRFFTACVALAFVAYFALFLHSAQSVDIRILPYYNWIFN